MQNILEKYDYIIFDFSAMFAELDNDFIKVLNEGEEILVSPTFDCECRQIQKVVPYRIAMRYKDNKSSIITDNLTICKSYGTIDTFGLANCLSHDSNSVLVVEANYSLEDRIVLSGTNVDVYSLFDERIIKHDNYPREAVQRAINMSKTPLVYYEVKSGDFIYTKNGQYVLADLVESGAEAHIFKVSDNPKILAKIYKKDENDNFVLTSQKLNNINGLIEISDNWDVLWVAWPMAALYADLEHTKPVGYVMKYFDEAEFLSNNSLFDGGDISAKFSKYPDVTIKDVLDICIKFVRQILFLALNDIHISDYNDKNFAIPINSDSKIVMVDTDSYCCEGYVSDCMTYSGCLSKKYECNTWLDLINLCDESLLAFVFTRLVLDSSFVPMRRSEFRFSESRMTRLDNPNIKAKWESIPKNLQNLFINIFDKKCPPSINVLLYELEMAYKQKFANTMYKDIYKNVLEMIAEQSAAQPEPPHRSVQTNFQPLHTQYSAPSKGKKKGKKMWFYIFAGIIIVLIALAVWWFGYSHSGRQDESIPSEQPSGAEAVETSLFQLLQYETGEGYYMSYETKFDSYIVLLK